jgi:hypothetical protein
MQGENPLAGCEAKLERAKVHFNSLDTVAAEFFESKTDTYRIVTEVDVKNSRFVGRVRITGEFPLDWSVIVGDVLQNLRAALDHVLWQLVIANGCKPGFGNSFPIFDKLPPEDPSHPDRERWNRHVKGVHPDAVRFIEFCQPYNGLDTPGPHTLTGLRKLSNEDKHRTLVPALSAVHGEKKHFTVRPVELRDIQPPTEKMQVRAGRPLKDGDLVFEMPVTIIGSNPEVKTKGSVPLDVGFGKPPVPMKGFKQMVEVVELILGRCRDLIGS